MHIIGQKYVHVQYTWENTGVGINSGPGDWGLKDPQRPKLLMEFCILRNVYIYSVLSLDTSASHSG